MSLEHFFVGFLHCFIVVILVILHLFSFIYGSIVLLCCRWLVFACSCGFFIGFLRNFGPGKQVRKQLDLFMKAIIG